MTQRSTVTLRPSEAADLPFFFRFQLDEEAQYLAAFTPKDQGDAPAYVAKFTRFLHDPTINMQTVLVDETIAGSIAKFEGNEAAEITYWLDRSCWGKGIATRALAAFLTLERARPLVGRVAFDNRGSQRVLEKCGFVRTGTNKGFANARQAEVVEFIYQLA